MIQPMEAVMSKREWMIYGATGYTGRKIAVEALDRGERPVLAGRNAAKVKALADELGLTWVAFDLADRARAVVELRKVRWVVLAAGPFDGLAQPMMDACLEAGTHYADVANEIAVLEAVQARHARAQSAGVSLVSGIGFGTIATTTLARRVTLALPNTVALECAMHVAVEGSGAGTGETGLAVVRAGGRVRRKGQLVPHPLGAGRQRVRFADRSRPASPLPLGDLEAAWMDTGVPDITVYGTALPGGLLQRVGIALVRRLLWIPFVRRQVASMKEGAEGDRHCQAWARATDANGREVEAWLEAGEGYAFTAMSAVRAAQQLLRTPLPGGHAAITALGPAFVETIPGTRVLLSLDESEKAAA